MSLSFRGSVVLAVIAVFSGLAVVLTSIRAEIPYPLLPYLKFDLAEIPVILVLLLVGPIPSLIAETIHWLGLTITHGWVLGPLMKFLAVTPTLLGLWLGVKYYKTRAGVRGYSPSSALGLGMLLGAVFRVIVCSLTNVVVFLYVAPGYLSFAEGVLRSVGLPIGSTFDVWVWTLALTALFNTLHVPISCILAAMIFRGAALRVGWLSEKSWLFSRR